MELFFMLCAYYQLDKWPKRQLECHGLIFGLTTKTWKANMPRKCCRTQMQTHTCKCGKVNANILGVEVLWCLNVWNRSVNNKWCSKKDFFKMLEMVLKCRYQKWGCILHLEILSSSYGQKSGQKSNWQLNSQPLKPKK